MIAKKVEKKKSRQIFEENLFYYNFFNFNRRHYYFKLYRRDTLGIYGCFASWLSVS